MLAVFGGMFATAFVAVTCAAAPPKAPSPAKATAAPPQSESPKPPAGKDPCADAADEVALRTCRQRENRESEAALRQVTDRLTTRYTDDEPARAKALATAQGKWRDYRDAECKLRTFDSAGGTAHEVYWLSCLTALNQERLATLRKLVDNP